MTQTERIPGPRGLPILGNYLDLRNEEGFIKGMEGLIDIYGPAVQVTIQGVKNILIGSADLLREFTDETQWAKIPPPSLAGGIGPQGLFTARNDDPDWSQAHRILAPSFGPLKIGDMFEGMQDIAHQMIRKWARQDEDQRILLTDDATRLTLDTIALCTMDFRFNSFYSETMHPFVDAMLAYLSTAQKLAQQPALMTKLLGSADLATLKESGDFMNSIAQQIIDKRRAKPQDKNDMLNTLLHGRDPKTGATMRDGLIIAEMITFLVAGHETTSGMISFAFMHLLQNPKTYLKAQQEVDRVSASGPLNMESLSQLEYLNAIFRETMRLTPTAPIMSKKPASHRKNEHITFGGGKHYFEDGAIVRLLVGKSMRDPAYFGEDAEDFNPDRMSEDNPNYERYMKVWKPFGNGTRSCIGQAFAWQEALLITALILQNFDMSFADPGYKLKIKHTLTVKPDNMFIKIRPRKGLDAFKIEQRLSGEKLQSPGQNIDSTESPTSNVSAKAGPVILFGSNSGTCQSLAQKMASIFAVKARVSATVQELDSAVNNISTEQPLIIFTSSYEGQPPDNAARFLAWLESSKSSLAGVKYAVFGCGHKDWRDTFQRIPRLVDRLLEERGATRIVGLGSTDVSEGKVLDDFNKWQDKLVTIVRADDPSIDQQDSSSPEDLAEISTNTRAQHLSSGLSLGKVKEVRLLTEPDQPQKKHMEVELPDGMEYEVGDYLSVLPLNPEELVRRIMNHWGLPRDATIILKTSAFGSLPSNVPLGIHDLLKGFFELSQPVSKSSITDLRQFTKDADTLKTLDSLLTDDKEFAKIVASHSSLFDVISSHPTVKVPFQIFLSSLLPLHIRQYSISSSPLANPKTCTITFTVVRHDTKPTYAHEGVASTYLSTLAPGDTIQLGIKGTATAHLACPFRLPPASIQSSTPLIMYCAGTGLAPFRGFVQQRAIMLQSNPDIKLAPAVLFVGCRSASSDRLYADEFAEWERLGAVSMRYAFSQDPNHELSAGCKYVGDRILKDSAEVRGLWENGARAYMCGSRKVQDSVKECVGGIFKEIAKEKGWSVEEMESQRENFRKTLAGRAVNDIFD